MIRSSVDILALVATERAEQKRAANDVHINTAAGDAEQKRAANDVHIYNMANAEYQYHNNARELSSYIGMVAREQNKRFNVPTTALKLYNEHNFLCTKEHWPSLRMFAATTVVAFDKRVLCAGTFSVTHVYVDQEVVTVNGNMFADHTRNSTSDSMKRLSRCMRLVGAIPHFLEIDGDDSLDGAIPHFGESQPLFDGEEARETTESRVNASNRLYPKITYKERVWEIPFNPKNKYQVTVRSQPNTKNALLLMHGSPETILARCDHIWHKGARSFLLLFGVRYILF